MEPVEITAGRLHLRQFRLADVDAMTRACQDPLIQYYTSLPSPYEVSDARRYIEVYCPAAWANGSGATFAVVDSTSAELLANVALNHIGLFDTAVGEIQYWCAPWARGQGVVPQAVGAVCRWAFAMLDLVRIEWYAEVGNTASRRVAEKTGFLVEGVLRSRLYHRGERVDAWAGSLLRDDLA